MDQKAVQAAESNRYDDAFRLYRQELRLLAASGRQADAAGVYVTLGGIEHVRGAFTDAEASYKAGLEMLRHAASMNDPRVVNALDGLAWLYVTWGRYREASSLFDEAARIADRTPLGPSDLIRHFDTQAAYLTTIGRFSEAQKEWDEALDVGQSHYAADQSQYDIVLLHAGQASALYGNYSLAAQKFQRYLAMEQPMSDRANAISRAIAEAELGHVYLRLKKFSDARPLLEKARSDFEGVPKTAPLLYSIVLSYSGDFFMAKRQWCEAETNYRQALAIRQTMLGDSYATAASMSSLAATLRKLHSKTEAKQLETRAKAIFAAAQFPERVQTVDVLALRTQ